jgi:hypothetical protein
MLKVLVPSLTRPSHTALPPASRRKVTSLFSLSFLHPAKIALASTSRVRA